VLAVTRASPNRVGVSRLVARTVKVPSVVPAVKSPAALIVPPPETDQVTSGKAPRPPATP
jgi:hypothetical protein